MTIIAYAGLAFALFFSALHCISVLIAAMRIKPVRGACPLPQPSAPVSIIIPLCGLENFSVETLRSAFVLDYPCYELIFCLQRASDPILPLVERQMRAFKQIPARILIGDDPISQNPKLNNCVKGWAAAHYDWIVLADSNVLMPKDYVQRLISAWRPKTGLVCSTPLGTRAHNFAAHLEAAFLNSYQAKWQYVAESVGLGFAQGKSMLWHRSVLSDVGGIVALGREIAEDATATKIVREKGLYVHLVDNPFAQPLGLRKLPQVWARQLRWARLRRVTFPLYFLPEIFSGALFPVLALVFSLRVLAPDLVLPMLIAELVLWFGVEILLEWRCGWPMSLMGVVAKILRDMLLPILFVEAWLGDEFIWRGNAMSVATNQHDKVVTEKLSLADAFALLKVRMQALRLPKLSI